jgi:hypothetical protein
MKHVLAIASLLILAPSGFATNWTEGFSAAKKSAKENHKDFLIDFTGSDWCDQATLKLIDEEIKIAPDTATAADLRDHRKEIEE